MIITVKPVDREKWHGKAGVESFTRSKAFNAQISGTTNQYSVAFKEGEREALEARLGFDLSLTPPLDGSPHPFWDSPQATVKLENRTNLFNLKNDLDLIKVRVMQGSTIVANNEKEASEGEYDFYIFSEEEEMQQKAAKINVVNRARKLALEMARERKEWLITILKGEHVSGRSQEFVDVIIDELINSDAAVFVQYAEQDKEELFNRHLLLQGVMTNVLTEDGPAIYYNGKKLGYDIDEALQYISDPKNQELKVRIMEKLNM